MKEAIMEESEDEIRDDEDDLGMMMGVARQLATAGKRRASTNALAIQESLKEKMAKSKEKRMERVNKISRPHQQMCAMIGLYLGIPSAEVVDGLIDSDEQLDCVDSFLARDGFMSVIFYYHDGPNYELETGRFNLTAPPDAKIKRIYVSQGQYFSINFKAIVAYKVLNVEITDGNCRDDIFYTDFDLPHVNRNCVALAYNLMHELLSKPLGMNKDWGDLSKTEHGRRKQVVFERDFASFVSFLEKTKSDLEGVINFDYDKMLNTQLTERTKDANRLDKEFVLELEATVRTWNKKIERALVQYQQVRRENEFVGPLVEVEYWRNQLARFTSIVEFITSEECLQLIEFCRVVASPNLKIWKKQNNAVTAARNECADNVKYLYSLETFCEPLYRCNPEELVVHLPPLLYAIRMIFTTSRYYNNMSNITAILVKVSNQIVNVCRSYLNCKSTKTVWNQPKKIVLEKIKQCLDLYLKYYQCFKRTQQEMKEADQSEFGCSEMFVFGKVETFKKRLEEIVNVISTTTKYSILESSTIEGIEEFSQKFRSFYIKISSQKYDTLNHRLPDFDRDYAEFRQNVVDTEWLLEEFVGVCLAKMQDVDNVLRILKRFEKLNLECLHLDERYLEAMVMFQDELGNLRDRYNEERQAPILARNMPPVSGRILWIRHFYRRIEMPMLVFKEKPRVMKHRRVQKCIQLYNALAMVFVHYENLYHGAWYKFAGQVRFCLNAPIMIRNRATRRYVVNFDNYIIEVIRESEYMYMLQLAVPDVGQVLVLCKDKILQSYEMAKSLIERNNFIRSQLPTLFIPLMRTVLLKLENAFLPAFSTLTWTSMLIPSFCHHVTEVLDSVELFVKTVKDIKEARIDEVLETVALTNLVYLPEIPCYPNEFLEGNIKHRLEKAKEIEMKSKSVEAAVIDLITRFLDRLDQPELQEGKYKWLDPERALKPIGSSSHLDGNIESAFKEVDRDAVITLELVHNDCIELFGYFNMKFNEALVKSTKTSLEQLKARGTTLTGDESKPMIKTDMELKIPIITIDPTLDEMQDCFAAVLANIIDTNKYISLWGQKGNTKGRSTEALRKMDSKIGTQKMALKNYYKQVSENKEIIRVFMSLQGAMYLVKPEISKLLNDYLDFSYVWAEDRNEQINEFCEKNPLIVEIAEQFQIYDDRIDAIKNSSNGLDVGPILVNTGNIKNVFFRTILTSKFILTLEMFMFVYTDQVRSFRDYMRNKLGKICSGYFKRSC